MRRIINRIIIIFFISIIFAACSNVNKNQLDEEPDWPESTITEEEVVKYCTDTFHRDIRVLERESKSSFFVCPEDDESLSFTVYGEYFNNNLGVKLYDTMNYAVVKAARGKVQIPEGLTVFRPDDWYSLMVSIYDFDDIISVTDYFFNICNTIKIIAKDDYDKIRFTTSIFHDYGVWSDALIFQSQMKDLETLKKTDFISLLTEHFNYREDVLEITKHDIETEGLVDILFNRIEAYDHLGISFKLTVKPEYAESDDYSMIFQSLDDLKLSKIEYQEQFKELYDKSLAHKINN